MTTPQLRDALRGIGEQCRALRDGVASAGLDSIRQHRLQAALDRMNHDALRAVSILDNRRFPVPFPREDKP